MTHVDEVRKLRNFARSTDRESLVFVGRVAELGLLHDHLEGMWERWQDGHGAEGQTTIIHACPGMGKTALIGEFGKQAKSQEHAVVHASMEDLASFERLNESITRGLTAHPQWKALGIALAKDVGKFMKLPALAEAAVRYKVQARGAVVVMVDEAQDLKERHMECAKWLHMGTHGWPILPIYAGTGGTREAMKDAGIYRIGRNRQLRLQPMPPEETHLAFPAMCQKYGVMLDAAESQWTEAISKDSVGFPQHLNVGLCEAAGEIVDAVEEGREPSLRIARENAAVSRRNYYRDRLGPTLQRQGVGMLAVVRAIRKTGELHRDDAADVLRDSMNAERKRKKRPPVADGEDEALIERAIQNGVFEINADGNVELSIPSMGDYIKRAFGRV